MMYERQQQPSAKYLPPTVIKNYVHSWITTSIPTYGEVIAYVTGFNERNGMVSMFMYQPPYYTQPQFIQVHHSDMIGVSPYYGPIPPRPMYGGGGPYPGGRPPHGGHGGQGGSIWPWLFYQTFGTGPGR